MSTYIRVFPASMTNDWGRILSEKNMKSILGFVASARAVVNGFSLNPTQLTSSASTLIAKISSGQAIFEGYQVEFNYEQYSIPFPNDIVTGEYYICLRIKFATGTSNFINYSNFLDLPEGFDKNCPFVVVQNNSENIPDNESIEAGYIYSYLPLYKLIYINRELTSSGPIDVRNRSFINLDKILLGYKDDNINNYFGFDGLDSTEGLQDWKIKRGLTRGGELQSAEELLFQYIDFIHTKIRGYTTLNSITTGNPDSIQWDTEDLDEVNGEGPLPIINTTNPEESIVRRLKININGTREFINNKIIIPVVSGDNVTYNPANYSLGHILTLDNNKLLNNLFLSRASTSSPGIVQIAEAFTADNDDTYSDTKVLSVDGNGMVKFKGPRYSIAHIKYKELASMSPVTIDVVSNDSNLELDADQNIQLTAITSNKYNPTIKVAVHGTVGLAHGIHYDPAIDPSSFPGNAGKTYYTMNQNLKTDSNVTFNKATTAEVITPKITAPAGLSILGNTTINGTGMALTVNGELTADLVHNAGHNDLAEFFPKCPAEFNIEPGDIIAKVPGQSSYTLCSQTNVKLCVGVCSESPGFILGGEKLPRVDDNNEKNTPVALCGRVPVKIIGPIQEGDLITASYMPGIGVRSIEYVPGTIVGKALESKASIGIGIIEMLVMLA